MLPQKKIYVTCYCWRYELILTHFSFSLIFLRWITTTPWTTIPVLLHPFHALQFDPQPPTRHHPRSRPTSWAECHPSPPNPSWGFPSTRESWRWRGHRRLTFLCPHHHPSRRRKRWKWWTTTNRCLHPQVSRRSRTASDRGHGLCPDCKFIFLSFPCCRNFRKNCIP